MGDLIAVFLGLFVITSAAFWVVSITLFCLLIWFTEDDKDILAVIFIGGFIWLVSSQNEGWAIAANPLLWIKWFVSYIVAGCVWSFVKWFSFLHKTKDKLKALKETFASKNNLTGKPSEWDAATFKSFATYLYKEKYVYRYLSGGSEYLSEEYIKTPQDIIPTVKNRFGDLVRWIVWWPMSVVWTVLNDPIRRIAEFVVRSLRTYYTKVANSVFGNEI